MSHPDQQSVGGWRAHVPNVLTCLRVVLACGLFAMLSVWRYADSPAAARGGGVDWFLLAAAGLFVAAAVTDALDGYLARRWKAVSVFGRIMDPFADKLLVIGAFAFMSSAAFWWEQAEGGGRQVSGVQAWMVAVVLGRELLVTSIRGAMEGMGVSFAASGSGKVKMILQSVVIPLVLVILATTRVTGSPRPVAGVAIDVAVWATVIVTAWSGLPYVSRAAGAARGLVAPKPEVKG
jgi:CDP-diacylglycerol--glycerol-3-phosphate 3-phosphatidyltransferase